MLDPRTISRRTFMRRMLGAGVGLLSLEFAGATLAMLWPGPGDGLGVEHRLGTLDQINSRCAVRVPPGPCISRECAGRDGDGARR
jgi:hypothetical protein